MPHLSLALLGGFAAALDGQPLTAFGTDKVRALLAYLSVESARPHQRAGLAGLLWPDSPQEKAAHSLRQTVLRLRRALHEDQALASIGRQPFVLLAGQSVQLNPLADCQLDVARFTELLAASRQHAHAQAATCAVCMGWLAQAADLYRGDFLAGFALRDSVPFEEWQLVQQEALHRQAVEALAQLATYHAGRAEHERVQRYAGRLVTLDPWHEQGLLLLMRALARDGQAAAAAEQYARYSHTLAEEFGMLPSAEVTALFQQIQAGQIEHGPARGRSPGRVANGGASTSEPDQRRQITALICGWRDPAAHGDPEELHQRLAGSESWFQALLDRYGGYRQQRHGDEWLIYFGYPQAYEDAARRAVHVGLALVAATRGADVVRVGIHTGVMVVSGGAEPGSAARELVGDVPGVARDCQELAEPGAVLMTEDTARLVRGWFDCQRLGPRARAGSAQPIEVYRVHGEGALQSHIDWLARLHHLTPLAGRERELKQLAASLDTVVQGCGAILTLSGEPGIGKSRLVWELRQVCAPSTAWLEGRCSPYFQNTRLYPIVGLLEQVLGFAEGDSPEARRARLNRTLARYGLGQPGTAWLLALLLGLPTDPPAPQTITAQQRERMREVFVALLQRCAAAQPMVLVVEDLHWADPSTVEWLGASLDALATARCLTLLTYRPTFSPPWLPGARLRRLDLAPLIPPDIERMVADLAGAAALPGESRRRIVAQSDGIPLFVEELTKTLIEAGAQAPDAEIPTTLRDSLLARLDRVGHARETAGWAAALGREFAYPVLAAAVPYDEPRLQADLAALVEAELITVQPNARAARYAFKHALVQEAAHATLLRRTRQEYHRRIAEIYAARFPQIAEAQPELLAQHYSQAGLPAQAADQWLRAGERATAQGAMLEARIFFDRALEGIAPEDHERRWRALTGRQATLFLAGERAAEQADIAALLELADAAANQAWRAEALLCRLKQLNALGEYAAMPPLADTVIGAAQAAGNPGLEARALCLKAAALTRLGKPAARQTAEAAVARGRAAADEGAIAYAMGMLALHEAYAGDYARAAQLWTQVLELVRRGGDRALEARALSNLGAAYQYLGQFDQAQQYLEQGLALCDMIGDRHGHAYNVVNLGGVMLLSGDSAAAKRLFEQGLSEATAVDDASLRAGGLWELGRLAELSADDASATSYLQEAYQIYTELGMVARVMETTALLARSALGQGRPAEAREAAMQVWRYLQEHGSAAMDEAVPTYLTIAEVCEALASSTGALADGATVRTIVAAGHALVMARAERISDPLWRRSFLENVPSNRAVVDRWQRSSAG
ncbi:MAG: AAA family ATPase [Kouleothrix sp.]|nr:AAA family ATPase [Kouleothrix sp.]